MYDWMRYAILASIVMLIATALSYRADRKHGNGAASEQKWKA